MASSNYAKFMWEINRWEGKHVINDVFHLSNICWGMAKSGTHGGYWELLKENCLSLSSLDIFWRCGILFCILYEESMPSIIYSRFTFDGR